MAKNPCGKKVTPENAYAVYQDGRGEWTYYVLKHYQLEEKAKDHPYARYFCFVTSPLCPKGEYGDVYRVTVLTGNHRIANPFCTDKSTTGGQDETAS